MMVAAARRILLIEAKEILQYIERVFGKRLTRFELWRYQQWRIHPFPVVSRIGKRPRLAAWSDEVDRWCEARGWASTY